MKKYIYSLLAIIILATVLFYTNNAQKDTLPSEIKIGMIAPISGQFGFVGENVVTGARLYEKEWNTKHPNNKLTIIVEDDAFDAKKGVAAYKKLQDFDHVDAVFNTTSPTIDALYDTVARKDVPTVQLGEQGIPPVQDSIFQVTPAQTPMFVAFGTFVKSNVGTKPILLTSDIPAYKVFATAFKKSYGNIPETKLTTDQTSAKTLAIKLAQGEYTDYIVIASPQEASLLLKELLLVSKTKSHFFLDSSFISGLPEYQKVLGDTINKLEGSDVLSFKDISEDFKTKYKAFSGKEVGIGSDFGYEGVKVLVETKSKTDWIGEMQNAKVEGVTGEISFDKDGQRNPSYEMKKFVGGKIQ